MTALPTEIGVSCPRCGVGASAAAHFCAACGADIAAIPRVPPPPPLPTPAQPSPVPPPASVPGAVQCPGIEPSAVGRHASPLGWVAAILVAGGFLAASIGVIAAASRTTGAAAGTNSGAPLARWDRTLRDGSTVTSGTPFEIEVEAVNPAQAATDPLWLVIDWAPDGLGATPTARGRFVAAEPTGAAAREDPAAGTTVVSWPSLAPGERHTYRVTVVVTGLEPATTLWYSVRTGSGRDEASIGGGYTWDLDLEVE